MGLRRPRPVVRSKPALDCDSRPIAWAFGSRCCLRRLLLVSCRARLAARVHRRSADRHVRDQKWAGAARGRPLGPNSRRAWRLPRCWGTRRRWRERLGTARSRVAPVRAMASSSSRAGLPQVSPFSRRTSPLGHNPRWAVARYAAFPSASCAPNPVRLGRRRFLGNRCARGLRRGPRLRSNSSTAPFARTPVVARECVVPWPLACCRGRRLQRLLVHNGHSPRSHARASVTRWFACSPVRNDPSLVDRSSRLTARPACARSCERHIRSRREATRSPYRCCREPNRSRIRACFWARFWSSGPLVRLSL